MNYNLEIINLEKKYPDFKLNKINITVPKGQIVGFIGKNGSGKTTTIKAILNLINTDKGKIKIFGRNHKSLTKLDQEKIGVVLDDSFFSPIVDVNDINKLMQNFYTHWNEKLYYHYIKEFNIPTNKPLKEFSSGMKMKIKVICAICHDAKLLILDEPTNGLDPIFRYEILEIFSQFVSNKENSILLTTHITSDLEHIADELIFIDEGNIILDITKEKLNKEYGLVTLDKDKFLFSKEDYLKKLTLKNETLVLTNNKNKLAQKYPHLEIKKPTVEELMLLLIRGENV